MTLCDRVAALFRSQEGQWIDGRVISQVGGYAAWRSRIADLRQAPYRMDIRNRQQRIVNDDGSRYVVSTYCYPGLGIC